MMCHSHTMAQCKLDEPYHAIDGFKMFKAFTEIKCTGLISEIGYKNSNLLCQETGSWHHVKLGGFKMFKAFTERNV